MSYYDQVHDKICNILGDLINSLDKSIDLVSYRALINCLAEHYAFEHNKQFTAGNVEFGWIFFQIIDFLHITHNVLSPAITPEQFSKMLVNIPTFRTYCEEQVAGDEGWLMIKYDQEPITHGKEFLKEALKF